MHSHKTIAYPLSYPPASPNRSHSIIPSVIPAGTVLYHGRPDTKIPTVPDWLGFDFEHSQIFARAPGGYVLTFATKRALRVIAFDGLSAHQSRDTQQVFLRGRVFDDSVDGDARSGASFDPQTELCAWASKHNIDAFVRAEMHFELINCDFAGTLEVLSTLRVLPEEERIERSKSSASEEDSPGSPTSDAPSSLPVEVLLESSEPPGVPEGPGGSEGPWRGRVPPPAGWIGSFPTDLWTEVDMTAKRHDFAPGETRVRPVLSKFVTFYDPAVKSLMPGRRGKMRDLHRLLGIDKEEAKMIVRQLEEAVDDEKGWDDKTGASGVDWSSMLRVLVERYGERLEFLNYTLAVQHDSTSPSGASFLFARAFKARQQVLTMLTPYVTMLDKPPNSTSPLPGSPESDRRAWLAPIVQRCSAAHTHGLRTHLFTRQEHLLYSGVKTVVHEICRRLGRMFSFAYDIEIVPMDDGEEHVYGVVVEAMRGEIIALLEWLDWVQVWVKCRPSCAVNVSYVHQFYPAPGFVNFFFINLSPSLSHLRSSVSPRMGSLARSLPAGLEMTIQGATVPLNASRGLTHDTKPGDKLKELLGPWSRVDRQN
ncbi:hypothetical protein DL93DRAFT_119753 [Clavulina sp. PMI_390]|nr:hypothetical protein DL93DRAFT_119753 [Clavulina sp. PMI_390]